MTLSDSEIVVNQMCKVNLMSNAEFAATLPEPVLQLQGTFILNKYIAYANDLADVTNIVAHYGTIRTGGLQFALTDALASANDSYTYQVEFYAIDAPTLFQVFEQQLNRYRLVQQLSFDIGSYVEGRRIALDVIRYTSLYPKLLVAGDLTGNDLLITCKDTNGVGACKHISQALGIAEESISAACKVSMIGLDRYGQKQMAYTIIASNENYDDTPMHVILPTVSNDVVAVKVDLDYILTLQTIGETLHLTYSLVLTDEQVGTLHPLNADEIAGGVLTTFVVLSSQNEPIEGVTITISDGNKNLMEGITQENGTLAFKLNPGSYIVYVEYERMTKMIPITVSTAQIFTITYDVVLLSMNVQVIGSEQYALPNITLDSSGVTKVSSNAGIIQLRGIEGRVFSITHQLGQTLHQELTRMNAGTTVKMNLFNQFDDELMFQDELT
jgi:hypothetical protein